MAELKKWLYKRNEAGFINKEHEKLEKYLMIMAGLFIVTLFIFLLGWVFVEA